jgi:hypothetical protein
MSVGYATMQANFFLLMIVTISEFLGEIFNIYLPMLIVKKQAKSFIESVHSQLREKFADKMLRMQKG